jgi:Protein of unknown function (DUF2515)
VVDALDEILLAERVPDTIAAWKAASGRLLTDEACAFHRNIEISARYAALYRRLPVAFKWAGMAAFASHHVRLALFPLRLDTDRSGYVDLPRSLGRRKALLLDDVNTIRATNNAIFDDIFWVHLAYLSPGDGMGRLRTLLGDDPYYAAMLAGFDAIDRGRRILEDRSASADARREGADLVWAGNVRLLEHEQRELVQPHFELLSCASARLVSLGSATVFEVRGLRLEVTYFTSFYLTALTRGMPHAVRSRAWPLITCFDDRWRWISMSVVPRFRRFDMTPLIGSRIGRIVDDASVYADMPCVPPRVAT